MIPQKETNSNHKFINPSLYQIKSKFHRKHLYLYENEELYLAKVRVKNVFYRTYKEHEAENDAVYELNRHRYLKNKPLCGLRAVEIRSMAKLHWFNKLKNVMNLESLTMWIGKEDWDAVYGFSSTEAKVAFLIYCLKKLPKNIQKLNLYIEGLNCKDIQRIYRILGSLRKLKVFSRKFGLKGEESYLKKEYKYMNQYLSRRKKPIECFDFDFWRFQKDDWVQGKRWYDSCDERDQQDNQGMMAEGLAYKYVTHLTLGILGNRLQTFNQDGLEFCEEKEDFREGADENIEEEKLTLEEDLQREISPFYNFSLFPNLKSLTIEIQAGNLYPFGDFVTRGFQALTKLEKFCLNLEERPQGTSYVFQGLLHLPCLVSFGLEITLLREEEWLILQRFLENQKNLVSFSLFLLEENPLEESFNRQNKCLECLFDNLNQDSKIQSLKLASRGFTLKGISKALEKFICTDNQLKYLAIYGIDNPASDLEPTERIMSLCNLIKKQKDSLIEIDVNLFYVVIPEIICTLTASIGELATLKSLTLLINHLGGGEEEEDKNYSNFYESKLFEELFAEGKIKEGLYSLGENETWVRSIESMFKKLDQLDTVKIRLFARSGYPSPSHYGKLLSAILSLRSVKNIDINLPWKYPGLQNSIKIPKLLAVVNQSWKVRVKVDTQKLDSAAVAHQIQTSLSDAHFDHFQNLKLFC